VSIVDIQIKRSISRVSNSKVFSCGVAARNGLGVRIKTQFLIGKYNFGGFAGEKF